ncbi:hypothetical protein Tco_0579296 [Tanacetum coccineum]
MSARQLQMNSMLIIIYAETHSFGLKTEIVVPRHIQGMRQCIEIRLRTIVQSYPPASGNGGGGNRWQLRTSEEA